MKPGLYGTFGSLLIVLWGLRLKRRSFEEVGDVDIDHSSWHWQKLNDSGVCFLADTCFYFFSLMLI
jgi:hypothetical protein